MLKSWKELEQESIEDFKREATVSPKPKFACKGCRGTGKWAPFNNRFDVRKCFACNGKGYFLSSETDRKKAKKARAVKKQEQKRDNLNVCIELYGEEVVKYIYRGMVAASNNNSFLESLYESMGKYGSLTERQLAAVHRGMAKNVDRAKAVAVAKKPVAVVDLNIIREKLETAKGNNVRYPKLKAGDNYVFTLSQPTSKNPDHVYVKQGEQYLGKINPSGELFGYKLAQKHIDNIQEIAKDPLESAKAFGRKFGNCGMCNRTLTNHGSIDKGIGPICAEKYGL
jgi:hypothetical protein